jgi:hypothetical protein
VLLPPIAEQCGEDVFDVGQIAVGAASVGIPIKKIRHRIEIFSMEGKLNKSTYHGLQVRLKGRQAHGVPSQCLIVIT